MGENSSTVVNYEEYIDDNILAMTAKLKESHINIYQPFVHDRTNSVTKYYLQGCAD